jgi:hypothetical protein
MLLLRQTLIFDETLVRRAEPVASHRPLKYRLMQREPRPSQDFNWRAGRSGQVVRHSEEALRRQKSLRELNVL